MKRAALFFLMITAFIVSASAQIREIPAAVTDAFKSRYPHAENVAWKDKLTYFEAGFNLNNKEMEGDFSKKGEWRSSEAKINFDDLQASVKDGFSKSKYADWTRGSVTEIQRMGRAV